MRKASGKSCCEYSKRSVIKKYVKIVNSIEKRMAERNAVLERHFKMLLEPRPEAQDINTRMGTVLEKPLQLPPIFLTSSLGFNKHTWNKGAEVLLAEFNLERKLKYPTLRNALLFEKLKMLIMRLQEKEKRKR